MNIELTTSDADLIRRALVLFAQTHERDHSCADATRARRRATDMEAHAEPRGPGFEPPADLWREGSRR